MNTPPFMFVSLGRNMFTNLSYRDYNNISINMFLPFDLIVSTFADVIECFKTDFHNYIPTDFTNTTTDESGYNNYEVLKNENQSLIFNKTNVFLNKYELCGESNFPQILNNQIDKLRTLLEQNQQNQQIIFVRTILHYDTEITNITTFNNTIQELYPTLQYRLVIIIENQEITQFSHNIDDKTAVYTLNGNTDNIIPLNEFYYDINEIKALFEAIYTNIINQSPFTV